MFLPVPARSRTKVWLRVSCFLARSFPGARSGKYRQKCCEVLDLQMRGQQLRTLACRAFVPATPRRTAFFLLAFADPNSPLLKSPSPRFASSLRDRLLLRRLRVTPGF